MTETEECPCYIFTGVDGDQIYKVRRCRYCDPLLNRCMKFDCLLWEARGGYRFDPLNRYWTRSVALCDGKDIIYVDGLTNGA